MAARVEEEEEEEEEAQEAQEASASRPFRETPPASLPARRMTLRGHCGASSAPETKTRCAFHPQQLSSLPHDAPPLRLQLGLATARALPGREEEEEELEELETRPWLRRQQRLVHPGMRRVAARLPRESASAIVSSLRALS